MKLNYQCPICGTPLGYEGLCWKCKSEQDRNAFEQKTVGNSVTDIAIY